MILCQHSLSVFRYRIVDMEFMALILNKQQCTTFEKMRLSINQHYLFSVNVQNLPIHNHV